MVSELNILDNVKETKSEDSLQIIYEELAPGASFKLAFTSVYAKGVEAAAIHIRHDDGFGTDLSGRIISTHSKSVYLKALSLFAYLVCFIGIIFLLIESCYSNVIGNKKTALFRLNGLLCLLIGIFCLILETLL